MRVLHPVRHEEPEMPIVEAGGVVTQRVEVAGVVRGGLRPFQRQRQALVIPGRETGVLRIIGCRGASGLFGHRFGT